MKDPMLKQGKNVRSGRNKVLFPILLHSFGVKEVEESGVKLSLGRKRGK